jgi:hypothetical protein
VNAGDGGAGSLVGAKPKHADRVRFDLESPPTQEGGPGAQAILEYDRRFRNAPVAARQGAIDRRITLTADEDT